MLPTYRVLLLAAVSLVCSGDSQWHSDTDRCWSCTDNCAADCTSECGSKCDPEGHKASHTQECLDDCEEPCERRCYDTHCADLCSDDDDYTTMTPSQEQEL